MVRVWVEGDSAEGFRARITQTLDSTGREQATAATAQPEDVYAAVRTWVEAFVEQSSPPVAGPSTPKASPSGDARVT